MADKETNSILKEIRENKKLLETILQEIISLNEQLNKQITAPIVNDWIHTSPLATGGMNCDIERCKKTDAKHYQVRLEDGNGNLEMIEKNYCSMHFHEAQAKGVEFIQ